MEKEKAKPITKESADEYMKLRKEQRKIADSILDSAYSKLLSPDTTKESMLQMMLDGGLANPPPLTHSDGGIAYLIGSLSIKLTENFLNGKDINSQQYRKALEILKNLERSPFGTSYDMFDEYDESSYSSSCTLGYPIKACVTNLAIRKLKQECPNFSELLKIIAELDLRVEE